MSIEARQHPRARAKIRVEYHFGSTTGIGYTNDVSTGGLFLETDLVAPEGARIYLSLYVPGSAASRPLKMIGSVRRQNDARAASAPAGMGIRFEVAYTHAREALGGFVGEALTEPMSVRDSSFEGGDDSDDSRHTVPPRSVAFNTGGSSVWLWGLGIAMVVTAILRLLV